MNKQKTALVIGCTGQDGGYLCEFLLKKGYRVIGTKRRTSTINTYRVDHIYENPNFKMRYYDLNDSGAIYSLLNEYKPDEIYNLACQSHVKVSFEIPEHTVDGISQGTLRIMNAIRFICPGAKFYQASSSEMYGDNTSMPLNENSQMLPNSPYANAKLFAHNLCRNYRHSYKIFACSGILFNHESQNRSETFVSRKISLAAARIKLGIQDKILLGNMDAKRDWGYAPDYVEAMWRMLQQDEPDDYVIATGETHTVREWLEETFNLAGLDPYKYLKIDSRYFRPHEVPILLGDASKAKKILGWEPKTKFKDLVKIMYESDLKLVEKELKSR